MSNVLSRDNVPCLLLASWELECPMFEGEHVAGPVPTLFGEDPDTSKLAISANPGKAFTDTQRMMRCFFMPEVVSLEEAKAVVKKPR